MRWAGQVTRTTDMRNVYIILIGKTETKISFGKARLMWEDNINLDLKGIVWAEVKDQWRALLNTVMNLRVP
jgi:hypothetical protein